MVCIGVGVVGAGLSATTFHVPYLLANKRYALRAFLRRAPGKPVDGHPSVPVLTDAAAFLARSDVDLVIVTTPTHDHAASVRAALEADKHVLVEKPFAVTYAEARDLLALAAKRNLVLAVYQNRIFDDDFMTLQREMPRLGRVVSLESRFDRFRPAPKNGAWREDARLPGGGLLFDLGSHLIHQALVLFGRPARVHALVDNVRRIAGATDDWFQERLIA